MNTNYLFPLLVCVGLCAAGAFLSATICWSLCPKYRNINRVRRRRICMAVGTSRDAYIAYTQLHTQQPWRHTHSRTIKTKIVFYWSKRFNTRSSFMCSFLVCRMLMLMRMVKAFMHRPPLLLMATQMVLSERVSMCMRIRSTCAFAKQ